MKYKTKDIILVVLLVLLTQNIFFDIYRGAAFNVMPHDDYAQYLLHIVGDEEGKKAEAPYAYRILSVLPAVPFFYLLPVYRFTTMPERTDSYLRAIEALSLVSYFSLLVLCLLLYKITTHRLNGSRIAGVVAVFFVILLIRHVGILSADLIVLMYIGLIVYNLNNLKIYIPLIIISIILNEKITIIFSLMMFIRLFTTLKFYKVYLITPLLSLLIYFALRLLFPVQGNEWQIDPSLFFDNISYTLQCTLSLKGLVLNIFPTIICVALFIFAYFKRADENNINSLLFTRFDWLLIVGLFIIAHIVNVDYNVGRIVLHLFPLFLPLSSIYLVNYFLKKV